MMTINNINFINCIRCPAKDSIICDHKEGELVCNNCGEVYQENTTEEDTIKYQQNDLELGTVLEIKKKDN